ncbi:hypothetical protein H5410_019444 [Solanum commersonii]|uniref:Uncharacterized protein n=1 Tax=Solanum commersonii TaxID=4109 RepID=A0A9J5Z596_SOLCO|nr:hypothetical protein H5410_019444 [Solanum commersonii]
MYKITFPYTSSSILTAKELLVFGKEILSMSFVVTVLTNTWSSGMQMNEPRCLFGSASFGEIDILAGGCDSWRKYT